MLTITSFWIKTMDNPIEQARSMATGGGVTLLPILAMWLLSLIIGLAMHLPAAKRFGRRR